MVTPGTAKLTAQDAAFVGAIITDLEAQVLELRQLHERGYETSGGYSTLDAVYKAITAAGYYRPLAGQSWRREGTPEVASAEDYLDRLCDELYDGEYPGFRKGG